MIGGALFEDSQREETAVVSLDFEQLHEDKERAIRVTAAGRVISSD